MLHSLVATTGRHPVGGIPLIGRYFMRLSMWIAFFSVVLPGCRPGTDGKPAPPIPNVVCVQVGTGEITDFDEFVGRTEPSETVEVRSRGYGFLKEIRFQDGDYVNEGQELYKLEDDQYRAAHQRSLARITVAEARSATARATLARNEEMIKSQAISRAEYEESVAAVQEAVAGIDSAKADAVSTELDLEYTVIRAPISGQIDRTLVTKGNLVVGGNSTGTLLTRIVQTRPLYVYFEVDEASLLKYRRKRSEDDTGSPTQLREREIPCHVQLQDETGFPHPGVLDFAENRLNPGTGTIQLRGRFENEDRKLAAGMFVRVRVPVSEPYQAILVPEIAIGTDQSVKYVYTVDTSGVVARKNVELGGARGELRIVQSGLDVGETVITKGLQRVRPGVTVKVTMATQGS